MEVLCFLNAVYALAQLLELAAFLHLRAQHPDVPRPFAVPLSLAGCCCMLASPAAPQPQSTRLKAGGKACVETPFASS